LVITHRSVSEHVGCY
jgi:hypothetical protein